MWRVSRGYYPIVGLFDVDKYRKQRTALQKPSGLFPEGLGRTQMTRGRPEWCSGPKAADPNDACHFGSAAPRRRAFKPFATDCPG